MNTDLEAALNGAQPEPAPEPTPEQVEQPPVTVEEPAAEAAESPEPVAEEPTPEEPAEPAAEEPQMVPLAALKEVRRELQDLKSRMPQQEAPKAPDVLEDPEGYEQFTHRKTQNMVIGTKLETSRFLAEREFGADLVGQAFEYFNAHPEQSHALLAHPSPFHAAVEEFQKHKVAQEIGSDPQAYAEKVKAEALAQAKAELVAEQAKATAASAAPSMANVTGTGGGAKPLWNGPTPLDNLL